MFRIVYRSRLAKTVDRADIKVILEQSTKRNSQLGITGAWMECDGKCLSSIEGPPLAVKAVAESLWDDPRHTDFRLIAMGQTEQRLFDGWSLKFLDAAAVKDDPALREHEGVVWLAEKVGSLEGFYGDALVYHH